MQSLFKDESSTVEAKPSKTKTARLLLFAFLVLAAAVIGAASGLLLVYTVDLPQVGELEHYRPSSVTELYDDHGRVIGSFALHRIVIAS